MSQKKKKYQSKDWLTLRYVIQGRSPEEIAEECNVHQLTIYRALWKFGLLEKKDNPQKLYGRYRGKEIR